MVIIDDIKKTGGFELSGFREIDDSSMAIIKRMAGTYARKIAEHGTKIELIKITLKSVHKREKGEIYEIHSYIIDNGKKYASEAQDRNLFVAVDDALKRIVKELSRAAA